MDKPIKQVIILRKDLNMRKGKMVAQGGHAVNKIFFNSQRMKIVGNQAILSDLTPAMIYWMTDKARKIAVGVDTEEELVELYNKAKALGLECALIEDAGLTEFHGVVTKTAVILGPDFDEKIDVVSGHLKPL